VKLSSFYKTFNDIQNKDDFYNFLMSPFADNVLSQNRVEDTNFPSWNIDPVNKGVDLIILRQKRSAKKSCDGLNSIEGTILFPNASEAFCFNDVLDILG
jgi:hypothetical protein